MSDEYAKGTIQFFYDDGDIDWITFGFIASYASCGKDDISFSKSDEQIFSDAILLTHFLVDSGDFEPWTWRRSQAEHGEYSPYPGGIEQFCKDALADYHAHGLIFFVDHSMRYMLKKVHVGMPPPVHIPEEIVKIFQPA